MKQVITASACTLVIMALMIQMIYFQTAGAKLSAARSICASYAAEVKDGSFSADAGEKLKKDMARLASCSEEEVEVDVSSENMVLSVAIPVQGIIKAAGFWGIPGKKEKMIIRCAFFDDEEGL